MDISDFLFTNEAYQFVSQYIAPEMIIVIPILIFLTWLMRQTPSMKAWLIPYIVTTIGILAGVVITKSVEDGFIQGILVAAISVAIPIMYAQMKKKKKDAEKADSNKQSVVKRKSEKDMSDK